MNAVARIAVGHGLVWSLLAGAAARGGDVAVGDPRPSAPPDATATADDAVAAGRRALADVSGSWYDAQTDSLVPLEFNEWEGRKLWDLGPLLKVALWVGLALFLLAIVLLVYQLARNHAGRAPSRAAATLRGVVADQVEALGFLAERRRDDLLGQARFHYQQGNYGEAIIYLFSHQLVELDRSSVIRLARGKTNRQYLREAARAAALGDSLERTMLAFESVFFGRRQLDRAGFEACWHDLPRFEAQLKAVTP